MTDEPLSNLLVLNTPVQRQCDVLIDGAPRTVRLRIRASTPGIDAGPIVIGDRIDLSPIDDANEADLLRVHERHNHLVRRRPGERDEPMVMCANVDRLLCIVSSAQPKPAWGMLDRSLVIAEAQRIPPTVVLTKSDLKGADAAREHARMYEQVGYPVLSVSVVSGDGIEALREHTRQGITMMLGQSGVGKSALTAALSSESREVGKISRRTGKGQHTTTRARLVPLHGGGFLADPPGIRALVAWDIEDDRLAYLFPDLRKHIDDCKFGGGCTHIHEPGCSVLAALQRGEIDPRRHDAYARMLHKADRSSGPTLRAMDPDDPEFDPYQ